MESNQISGNKIKNEPAQSHAENFVVSCGVD